MQVDFVTSLISVSIMVALAVPGFILRRKNMLPEKAVAALVVVLIYVSQPFLTIDSFLEKDYNPELLGGMGLSLMFSFLFHALVFFVARLVFRFFPNKYTGDEIDPEMLQPPPFDKSKRICVITSFMGNVGFMGIPVMKALFPGHGEMLIYTAVFILGFNVASWTLGVFTITGNRKDMSLRRALLNPPTVSLVVALPLFFFKSYIPEAVMTPIASGVGYLADMTLPLSMIILGIRLADIKFAELFKDVKVYVVCFLKLVVAPLLCFGIMMLLRMIFPALESSVIITAYIIMAMPSASLALTFAEMFDGDRNTAVKATVLTTLLSTLTIPILMLMCVFV